MDWIVTYGPPLTYAGLSAALGCLDIEVPPEDYVIPLDKGEFSLTITAPKDRADALREIEGVTGLYPSSPMTPYGSGGD